MKIRINILFSKRNFFYCVGRRSTNYNFYGLRITKLQTFIVSLDDENLGRSYNFNNYDRYIDAIKSIFNQTVC
jgi:hypothetical protein